MADLHIESDPTAWPDPRFGPWWITCHWSVIDGHLECVGIDFRSFRPKNKKDGPWSRDVRPVSRDEGLQVVEITALRQALTAGLIEQSLKTKEAIYRHAAFMDPDVPAHIRKIAEKRLAEFRPGERGRPPVYGLDHFQKVADVVRSGGRKSSRTVADRFHVSISTANRWIRQTRDLGLLEEPTRATKAKKGRDR